MLSYIGLGYPKWTEMDSKKKKKNIAQSWPAFLYAGGQFDPNNPDNGLFKGKILEKVSPTSQKLMLLLILYSRPSKLFLFLQVLQRQPWTMRAPRDPLWQDIIKVKDRHRVTWQRGRYDSSWAVCHSLCGLPGKLITWCWCCQLIIELPVGSFCPVLCWFVGNCQWCVQHP